MEKCTTRANELFTLIEEENEQLVLQDSLRRSSSSTSSFTQASYSNKKTSNKVKLTRGCVNSDLSHLRKEFEKATLAEIIARQKLQCSTTSSAKPTTNLNTSSPRFSINLQMISDLLVARQDALSHFNEKLFSLFETKPKDFYSRADDEIWRKTLKIAISASKGDVLQPIGPVIGLLSHPTHPISHISRDFVVRLKQLLTCSTGKIDEISKQIVEEYHQFSFQMIKLLRHNYEEEFEDDSLKLQLQISIESFFFSHLPALSSGIHEFFIKANESEDSNFLSQINRLAWLNFDDEYALYTILGVPEKYQMPASKFESAIQELRFADSLKCPTLKALSIIKVCDLICLAIGVDGEDDASSHIPLGSEDLVLLHSWVIIQAQIPHIFSFLALISKFLPDDLMRGHAGYVFATIQTAVNHIKDLN